MLLTDGLPSQVPPAEDGSVATTVLRAAEAARGDGARIYTIGLGTPGEVDAALLTGVAGDPGRYLYAPDAEGLRDVYEAIASDFVCPPGWSEWRAEVTPTPRR